MTTPSLPPDPFTYDETLTLRVKVDGHNADRVTEILSAAAQAVRGVLDERDSFGDIVLVSDNALKEVY